MEGHEMQTTAQIKYSFPIFFGSFRIRNGIRNKMTELMERIVLRDDRALEELYERFSKVLYSVILAVVKKKEDAEEININNLLPSINGVFPRFVIWTGYSRICHQNIDLSIFTDSRSRCDHYAPRFGYINCVDRNSVRITEVPL